MPATRSRPAPFRARVPTIPVEGRAPAPPGVPPDRAKALRWAFREMVKDKAFLDEADRLGLDVSPIDADELLSLLARSAATPKDVIARFNELGTPKN